MDVGIYRQEEPVPPLLCLEPWKYEDPQWAIDYVDMDKVGEKFW